MKTDRSDTAKRPRCPCLSCVEKRKDSGASEYPAHPRAPPSEADGTPALGNCGRRAPPPDPAYGARSRIMFPAPEPEARMPAARNLRGPLRARKEHLRSAAQNGRLPSRNRKTFRSVARTHKKAAGPIRTRTGNRRLHKRRGNETARYGGGRGDDRELPGNGTDTQGLRRWCPQYDAERSHTDRDHRRRAKSTRNIAAPSGSPCPQYGKASGAVGAAGKAPCPRCGKRTAPAVFP